MDIAIYGKIIIDDIGLAGGSTVAGVLGGGGPQAVFGARLWGATVGLLSRAGMDLLHRHQTELAALGADLSGVALYPDLPTFTAPVSASDMDQPPARRTSPEIAWDRMLGRPLALPVSYEAAQLVHLITEYAAEPMVASALDLRTRHGATLSVEPLIGTSGSSDRSAMESLFASSDLVTPDWPSATAFADSDDPRGVIDYWSRLGPRLVAVRHAEHGSYVWCRDQNRAWHVPAVQVEEVVDPTGAGNAYGGGLCAGWLAAGNGFAAGAYAAVSASFLLEQPGVPALAAAQAAAKRRLSALVADITEL